MRKFVRNEMGIGNRLRAAAERRLDFGIDLTRYMAGQSALLDRAHVLGIGIAGIIGRRHQFAGDRLLRVRSALGWLGRLRLSRDMDSE
jgi:hypothetical protein